MKSEIELLRQAVDDVFKGLESSLALNKAQAERQTKEWQYLTDDEIKELIGSYGNEGGIGGYTRELFDKIEAKIKEKNERHRIK